MKTIIHFFKRVLGAARDFIKKNLSANRVECALRQRQYQDRERIRAAHARAKSA